MLLKLLPDQIARYWHVFAGGIAQTLPPIAGESPDRLNNILEALLTEGMSLWISFPRPPQGEEPDVHGFLVMQVIADEASRTKALLMYSIYAPNGFTDEEWAEGYQALAEYGRSKGCNRITGYSSNPQMVRRVEQFGGDSSYHFLSVPIQ